MKRSILTAVLFLSFEIRFSLQIDEKSVSALVCEIIMFSRHTAVGGIIIHTTYFPYIPRHYALILKVLFCTLHFRPSPRFSTADLGPPRARMRDYLDVLPRMS
jgi:hypothetical protein